MSGVRVPAPLFVSDTLFPKARYTSYDAVLTRYVFHVIVDHMVENPNCMATFRLAVAVVLGFVIFATCSRRGAVDPINQHYLDVPVVNGIWLYDADGIAVGVWGEPYTPPYPYGRTAISRVYPNPSTAVSTRVSIALPETSRVWMWVVRAVGPASIESQFKSLAGASVVIPAGVPLGDRMEGQTFTAGICSFVWNAFDSLHSDLPSGFYRVYIHVEGDKGDNFDGSVDLLFVREANCSAIPWELRELVSCF